MGEVLAYLQLKIRIELAGKRVKEKERCMIVGKRLSPLVLKLTCQAEMRMGIPVLLKYLS